MESTINVFTDGLTTDMHPLTTKETQLTDALNATMITFNGNEMLMLNDMGNSLTLDAPDGEPILLSEGFIPIGIKEHGGVVYIASVNKDGKGELGSFPSPLIKYSGDTRAPFTIDYDFLDWDSPEQGDLDYYVSKDGCNYNQSLLENSLWYNKLKNQIALGDTVVKFGDIFALLLRFDAQVWSLKFTIKAGKQQSEKVAISLDIFNVYSEDYAYIIDSTFKNNINLAFDFEGVYDSKPDDPSGTKNDPSGDGYFTIKNGFGFPKQSVVNLLRETENSEFSYITNLKLSVDLPEWVSEDTDVIVTIVKYYDYKNYYNDKPLFSTFDKDGNCNYDGFYNLFLKTETSNGTLIDVHTPAVNFKKSVSKRDSNKGWWFYYPDDTIDTSVDDDGKYTNLSAFLKYPNIPRGKLFADIQLNIPKEVQVYTYNYKDPNAYVIVSEREGDNYHVTINRAVKTTYNGPLTIDKIKLVEGSKYKIVNGRDTLAIAKGEGKIARFNTIADKLVDESSSLNKSFREQAAVIGSIKNSANESMNTIRKSAKRSGVNDTNKDYYLDDMKMVGTDTPWTYIGKVDDFMQVKTDEDSNTYIDLFNESKEENPNNSYVTQVENAVVEGTQSTNYTNTTHRASGKIPPIEFNIPANLDDLTVNLEFIAYHTYKGEKDVPLGKFRVIYNPLYEIDEKSDFVGLNVYNQAYDSFNTNLTIYDELSEWALLKELYTVEYAMSHPLYVHNAISLDYDGNDKGTIFIPGCVYIDENQQTQVYSDNQGGADISKSVDSHYSKFYTLAYSEKTGAKNALNFANNLFLLSIPYGITDIEEYLQLDKFKNFNENSLKQFYYTIKSNIHPNYSLYYSDDETLLKGYSVYKRGQRGTYSNTISYSMFGITMLAMTADLGFLHNGVGPSNFWEDSTPDDNTDNPSDEYLITNRNITLNHPLGKDSRYDSFSRLPTSEFGIKVHSYLWEDEEKSKIEYWGIIELLKNNQFKLNLLQFKNPKFLFNNSKLSLILLHDPKIINYGDLSAEITLTWDESKENLDSYKFIKNSEYSAENILNKDFNFITSSTPFLDLLYTLRIAILDKRLTDKDHWGAAIFAYPYFTLSIDAPDYPYSNYRIPTQIVKKSTDGSILAIDGGTPNIDYTTGWESVGDTKYDFPDGYTSTVPILYYTDCSFVLLGNIETGRYWLNINGEMDDIWLDNYESIYEELNKDNNIRVDYINEIMDKSLSIWARLFLLCRYEKYNISDLVDLYYLDGDKEISLLPYIQLNRFYGGYSNYLYINIWTKDSTEKMPEDYIHIPKNVNLYFKIKWEDRKRYIRNIGIYKLPEDKTPVFEEAICFSEQYNNVFEIECGSRLYYLRHFPDSPRIKRYGVYGYTDKDRGKIYLRTIDGNNIEESSSLYKNVNTLLKQYE